MLSPSVAILSSSVTVTVAEQAGWVKRRERLIGIGALPSLLEGSLIEIAPSDETAESTLLKAKEFTALLGKEAAIVQDSIGLVMPRILCMLTNEAYFAIMEGVAGGYDIDTAMKLGTNYPTGPVERGEKIGIRHIHAVLTALFKYFGEDRYRVAPLLEKATVR
jgi:3-hydroxybutyryl-CoA dehydrogenase